MRRISFNACVLKLVLCVRWNFFHFAVKHKHLHNFPFSNMAYTHFSYDHIYICHCVKIKYIQIVCDDVNGNPDATEGYCSTPFAFDEQKIYIGIVHRIILEKGRKYLILYSIRETVNSHAPAPPNSHYNI